LTELALDDLHAIQQFSVKEWGRQTADQYLNQIEAALDRIQQNPNLLHLEPDILKGLSFYRVKKHLLVCDCCDDFIIVLTIVHTSMDVQSRLLELEPRLVAESQLLRAKLHGMSSDD
jgi:plasmid stabilization system protein ParE